MDENEIEPEDEATREAVNALKEFKASVEPFELSYTFLPHDPLLYYIGVAPMIISDFYNLAQQSYIYELFISQFSEPGAVEKEKENLYDIAMDVVTQQGVSKKIAFRNMVVISEGVLTEDTLVKSFTSFWKAVCTPSDYAEERLELIIASGIFQKIGVALRSGIEGTSK